VHTLPDATPVHGTDDLRASSGRRALAYVLTSDSSTSTASYSAAPPTTTPLLLEHGRAAGRVFCARRGLVLNVGRRESSPSERRIHSSRATWCTSAAGVVTSFSSVIATPARFYLVSYLLTRIVRHDVSAAALQSGEIGSAANANRRRIHGTFIPMAYGRAARHGHDSARAGRMERCLRTPTRGNGVYLYFDDTDAVVFHQMPESRRNASSDRARWGRRAFTRLVIHAGCGTTNTRFC
jgi:5-keto 4-deoxyuronate isomerase